MEREIIAYLLSAAISATIVGADWGVRGVVARLNQRDKLTDVDR